MWKCNSCGASNPDESDVCSGCGAQKPQEAAVESAPKSNGMMTVVVMLAVVCVLLIGVIVYLTAQKKNDALQSAAPINATSEEILESAEAAETAEPETTAEPVFIQTLDREALFAAHEPDEVVAAVGGRDVTWQDYFYFLSNEAYSVENYIAQMTVYGGGASWADPWGSDEEPDENFADYVLRSTEDYVRLMTAIIELSEEHDAGLSDEDQSAVADAMAQTFVSALGEDPTEEAIEGYLKERYMTRPILERLISMDYLYSNTFNARYGENSSNVSDEDALKYLTENGYLSANHILFRTVDPATGEALSDEAVAEKLEKAQAIADELRAIEDQDVLLARFAELKSELDEDSGKVAHPDGYTFTSGVMVSEFEDAVKALEDYGVSEPVKSSYGYHVILRLPLRADAELTSSSGGGATARGLFATQDFSKVLHAKMDELTLDYADGFEKPDILQYLTETKIA